jgi:DNA anti-recombination protein RmuC
MDLLLDHYKGESQTLTTGAEENYHKFKQLIGMMTPKEEQRWEEIMEDFRRNKLLGGAGDDDPVGRVVGQLSVFSGGLKSIETTLNEQLSKPRTTTLDLGTLGESIEGLRETVAAHLANQQAAPAASANAEVNENLNALRGAFENYLAQSSSTASSAEEKQDWLADRQQKMMEFISQSNAQLVAAISQSQSQVQAAQLQSALTNIGNLFSSYQGRSRDLQQRLADAEPSEVVVNVSQEMAGDSDALIRQILEQLQGAQQQPPPPEEPPPPETG